MRKSVNKSRGYTFVELMITVAIIGLLAALAIYGVRKYVANAKTVEAKNALGQIAKDATTSYAREAMAGVVLGLGSTATKANALCPSGPPVPSAVATVAGRKYQSSPVDWTAGWECLRFSMQDPQYYVYEYELVGAGTAPGDWFAATALGDLDADGNVATFMYEGAIILDGVDLVVALGPNISEWDPDE